MPAQPSHTQQSSLVCEPANPCAQSTGIINYSLSKPRPTEPFLPGLLHFIFPKASRMVLLWTQGQGKASCKTSSWCIAGEPAFPDHTVCPWTEGTQGNLPGSSIHPPRGTQVTHVTQHNVPTSLFAANVQNQATAAPYKCSVV